MKLAFIPQLPVKNRYQEQWIKYFPARLEAEGFDVLTITGGTEGPNYIPVDATNYFTDISGALKWEARQIVKLTNALGQGMVDAIFFADIDFPGLCVPLVTNLKLLYNIPVYGFLHAGSYCNGDIYSKVKNAKYYQERSMLYLFDKIFVGSCYHKSKFEVNFGTNENIIITGTPYFTEAYSELNLPDKMEKKYEVIVVGRPEQSNLDIIRYIAKEFDVYSTHKIEGVKHLIVKNTEEYFKVLKQSKVAFSAKLEETFGLWIADCYMTDTIPIAPHAFSYPEIISSNDLLYYNKPGAADAVMEAMRISFTFKDGIEKAIRGIIRPEGFLRSVKMISEVIKNESSRLPK